MSANNEVISEAIPDRCFAFVMSNERGKQVVAIKRGEKGYFPTTYDVEDPVKAQELVEHLNTNKLGVSKEQAEAMLMGSMFGWDTPGAKLAVGPNNREQIEGRTTGRMKLTQEIRPDVVMFAKAFNSCFGLQGNVMEAITAYEQGGKYGELVDGTAIVDGWLLWGEAQKALLSLPEVKKYSEKIEGESVDRLHALTELNPEIPKMPDMAAKFVPSPELVRWISDPKVYHYLKRLEEAMPDLLIAANEFVDFACEQNVSHRLTGTKPDVFVSEETKKQSYEAALKLADGKNLSGLFNPTNDRCYAGKILGVTDLHVVQNLGRHVVIIEKAQLNSVPVMGQEVDITFTDGKGTVAELGKGSGKEVGR